MPIYHATTVTAGDGFNATGVTRYNEAHAVTGSLTLAAGTTGTSGAPLQWQSGSLETAVDAGDMEYDGKVLYFTPQGAQRGAIPCEQIAAIQSHLTWSYTNSTTDIPVFDAANDTVALSAGTTYIVEGQYIIYAGTTTHTTSLSFVAGGSLTVTNFEYTATLWSAALNTIATAQSTTHVSGIGAKAINATMTTADTIIQIRGVLRVNAGGTLQPCFRVSADPTTTGSPNTLRQIAIGTYLKFTPIGSGTVQAVGAWS